MSHNAHDNKATKYKLIKGRIHNWCTKLTWFQTIPETWGSLLLKWNTANTTCLFKYKNAQISILVWLKYQENPKPEPYLWLLFVISWKGYSWWLAFILNSLLVDFWGQDILFKGSEFSDLLCLLSKIKYWASAYKLYHNFLILDTLVFFLKHKNDNFAGCFMCNRTYLVHVRIEPILHHNV